MQATVARYDATENEYSLARSSGRSRHTWHSVWPNQPCTCATAGCLSLSCWRCALRSEGETDPDDEVGVTVPSQAVDGLARPIRVGAYAPSPVYYRSGLYRHIAADPRIEFTAIFSSSAGVRPGDLGYGRPIVVRLRRSRGLQERVS